MGISENLASVKERIQAACEKANRIPCDVTLIAVSKTKPLTDLREALQSGQSLFGENYVQELVNKKKELGGAARFHLIGPLQRNKVKDLINHCAMIHSLDSIKLAESIHRTFEQPIDCLIQVNIAQELSKSGVSEGELVGLVRHCSTCERINLRGLMCIPPFEQDPEKSRAYFKRLAALKEEINQQKLYHRPLRDLSMGMSHDFEVAIEEGATMIRIGHAIFGDR